MLPSGLAAPGLEAPLIADALARVPGPLTEAGPRLISAGVSGSGAAPALTVTLASDAVPSRAPDLFVEGIPDATPTEPRVRLGSAGRTATPTVPLSPDAAVEVIAGQVGHSGRLPGKPRSSVVGRKIKNPSNFKRPAVPRESREVSMQISAQMPRAKTLEEALALIVRHLGTDTATVHFMAEDGLLHLAAATSGLPAAVLSTIEVIPVGKGMAGLAVERRRPVDACNIQTDRSGDVRPGARATGLAGAVVVPVFRDDDVVGALGVAQRSVRVFSEAETQDLIEVGRMLVKLVPAPTVPCLACEEPSTSC